MNRFFVVLIALCLPFLSAVAATVVGTYSYDSTGNPEQILRVFFHADGTVTQAIGSSKIPTVAVYQVVGNKIKVEGGGGFTILENGDLIGGGQRFKKEVARPQAALAPKVEIAQQQPAPAPTIGIVQQQPAAAIVAAPSPSFDCAKASTFAEKSICGTPLLAKLDSALAANYKGMLGADFGGSKKSLRDDQIKWLASRNKCTDIKCLVDVYRTRVDETCDYGVVSGAHPECTSSADIK